jgi:hypothetical protein
MERKCPVIPTILGSATTTPELPWTLENRHRVDFRIADPDPLKQLIWGITGQKPAGREQLIPGKEEKAASTKTFSQARLYPPLLQPPDPEQATQLEILRGRVKEYWVDGVLKHSLHNEVLISLDKRQVDEFVDAPWKYTVEVSDVVRSGPLAYRDVKAIYYATGLLLILGEPGSGKSTTLLDLARTLLDRAEKDIKERVPIVLNLSSWKKQPLTEWMSDELWEKYRVPRKIARPWLQKNYLLPLLDGLDEVETSLQPDCVTAINVFIEQFNPPGLVVCCRLNEYLWLPERLKLNGAICLEPLSEDEVDEYLASGGTKLAALRQAISTDPVLQELAETPLMLSIMSLAFQGAGGSDLVRQNGDSPEERRKQIFRLYVEQMFQRKGTASLLFPKEKTIRWLLWLASTMREHSQSVFLLEGLQPGWLGTRAKRAAYGGVVALSVGLIFWLISAWTLDSSTRLSILLAVAVVLGCWSKSPLENGVMSGSIAGLSNGLIEGLSYGMGLGPLTGLINGLDFALLAGLYGGAIGGLGVGSLSHITLVETVSWKWNHFWKKAILGSIFGLILGLIAGLIESQRGGLSDGMLVIVLTFCLFFGMLGGLIGGLTDRIKESKASPNQGIKLSWRNSLAAFLVTWLACGLIGGLSDALREGLSDALITGLNVGLFAGSVVCLNRGGSAVIKHYALRLTLWLSGYTPRNFVAFLDHCAKLIFLKKVGGGYIFIHRMLLEYFADLTPEKDLPKRQEPRNRV